MLVCWERENEIKTGSGKGRETEKGLKGGSGTQEKKRKEEKKTANIEARN
jgi:hypothetical protein